MTPFTKQMPQAIKGGLEDLVPGFVSTLSPSPPVSSNRTGRVSYSLWAPLTQFPLYERPCPSSPSQKAPLSLRLRFQILSQGTSAGTSPPPPPRPLPADPHQLTPRGSILCIPPSQAWHSWAQVWPCAATTARNAPRMRLLSPGPGLGTPYPRSPLGSLCPTMFCGAASTWLSPQDLAPLWSHQVLCLRFLPAMAFYLHSG